MRRQYCMLPSFSAVNGSTWGEESLDSHGPCRQSPATCALRPTRFKDSTWYTKKSFLVCRHCWLIGRAIGEINQSKYSFKPLVLSVPAVLVSHLQCPCFFFSHFEQVKGHIPSTAHEAAFYLLLPEQPFLWCCTIALGEATSFQWQWVFLLLISE